MNEDEILNVVCNRMKDFVFEKEFFSENPEKSISIRITIMEWNHFGVEYVTKIGDKTYSHESLKDAIKTYVDDGWKI